jgi:hypothetical protein
MLSLAALHDQQAALMKQRTQLDMRLAAVTRAIAGHPDHVAEKRRKRAARLREDQLPSDYFRRVLVDEPCDSALGALIGLEYEYDPDGTTLRHNIRSGVFTLTLTFEKKTVEYELIVENSWESFAVKTWRGKPDHYLTLRDEDLWSQLMTLNENEVPHALVALVKYAAEGEYEEYDDCILATVWAHNAKQRAKAKERNAW